MSDADVIDQEFRRLSDLIESASSVRDRQIIIRKWYTEVSTKHSKGVADSAYRLLKMTENLRDDEPDKTTQRWLAVIGALFFAGMLGFLMYAAMQKGLDPHQMQIIRVICALAAGFAAAFISGAALFRAEFNWGGKVIICGSAGAAFFFAVFFGFNMLL